MTKIIAGKSKTLPVAIFPTAVPIDEMKVIASELAIVIRVGIFKTTIIIGTSINAPAAPTIPAATPTISRSEERRVGKECRARRSRRAKKEKNEEIEGE